MIIVSHRGPFGFSVDDVGRVRTRCGGRAASRARSTTSSRRATLADATCVSAALGDGDRRVAAGEPHPDVGTDVCFVELDPEAHRLHYEVVSNEVLWFLFHGIFDLPRSPTFGHAFRDAWAAYVEVNRAFADRVAELAPDGELVLVQDYPLALVPGMLADDRPDLRLCYFAHTPFSGPGGDAHAPRPTSPTSSARRSPRRPCGFHTRRWADAYEGSTRMVLGPDAVIAPTFAASLGPDPAGLAESAASPAVQAAHAELDELVGDRALVYRSDRIDLTKNIARGFMAYDELLAAHPEWRERVVFVAQAQPVARERARVRGLQRGDRARRRSASTNGGRTSSWTPLVVDTRDDYERTVAGFLRYDVLLVNPIKDGLNLVAKEGPLVNTRDGVLCLSPEAGAYEELHDAALRVHPYDLEQTADALHRALSMPPTNEPPGPPTCARPLPRAPRDVARRPGRARPLTPRAPRTCVAARHRVATQVRGQAPSASASESISAARPSGPSTTTSASRTGSGASADDTPMLTPAPSAPSRWSRASSANAATSPSSSPANAGRVQAGDELGDRAALVDRHRWAELHRHAAAHRRLEPVRRRSRRAPR